MDHGASLCSNWDWIAKISMSRVVILGYGVVGKAAASYYRKKGIEPIILDKDEPFDFLPNDYVIKSPGIRRDHPWVLAAKNCVEEAELGLQQLKGTVLGITGSNGKTTTTLMVAHVTGAVACGNIGCALLDAQEGDLHVVELSSFQLSGIQGGPYFDAAVILNITPNHLDWHGSFEAYRNAKLRMELCMKRGAPLWKPPLPEKVESLFRKRYRNEKLYVAPHDWENMSAAWLLCQRVGVTREHFIEKMLTFKKPPHRMEWVTQRGGVDFINDSKATSIDAVKKALGALKQPIHLIAGGVDKGGSFAEWGAFNQLSSIFAIGEAAKRIERELEGRCLVTLVGDLEEAVQKARLVAKNGECVLLSPGCSSYDQFRNYEERGERFRELVLNEGKR